MPFFNRTTPPACNGKAEWKLSNNQKYLDIIADDYYSLGLLEGIYLKKYIKQMRNFIFFTSPPLVRKLYKHINLDAQIFLKYIPEDYIREMTGIADGCGLSFNDILIQNVYWDLLFGKYFPGKFKKTQVMGCTACGAINRDGSTIVGQTYDFPKVMNNKGLLNGGLWPTLSFVCHQVADKPKIFGLRMGAELNLPTAKNIHNLTVIFNIIISKVHAQPTMPFCIGARYALEQAKTAAEYMDLLYSEPIHPVSHNVIIADKNKMIGIQALPFQNRSRTGQTLINTNRYIYDDWNEQYFAKGSYSLTRQQNAEKLIQATYQYSSLTDRALLSILGRKYIMGEPQDSEICRNSGLFGSSTLAFLTTYSYGIGNVQDGVGTNPF